MAVCFLDFRDEKTVRWDFRLRIETIRNVRILWGLTKIEPGTILLESLYDVLVKMERTGHRGGCINVYRVFRRRPCDGISKEGSLFHADIKSTIWCREDGRIRPYLMR